MATKPRGGGDRATKKRTFFCGFPKSAGSEDTQYFGLMLKANNYLTVYIDVRLISVACHDWNGANLAIKRGGVGLLEMI